MDNLKRKAIQEVVDTSMKSFVDGLDLKYTSEVNNPDGVINSKKNNVFIAELGEEFMFYSAFVRSFDSSFGKVLENMGNAIAKLSYDVKGRIDSYLLTQQSQHIDYLLSEYETNHTKPKVEDYSTFTCMHPKDITSFTKSHETDNYFYNPLKKEHYIIELKAGGDLDNKKAKVEKNELLQEYFLLKNLIKNDENVKIYLATAYNKYGEGKEWKQGRVQQYFSQDELLIGKDYWNFVCNSEEGFNIVFEQYKKSATYVKNVLTIIKDMYFKANN